MNCVICKQSETAAAIVTVTLERGPTTLVFKRVPAQVCENCGESYLDESTSRRLLEQAEAAVRPGVEVEIRTYAA
jgi:YgiT-type zinc finger domain-containing protein